MINLIMNDDKVQYENDIPIFFSNEVEKNDFEKIYAPIAQNRKLRNSLIEKAKIDEENIYCNADSFYQHCRNRTEYYCGKRSFMSYIEINKIIELINKSSLKDVYTIANSFSVIYYMGNIKDFYLRDLELLKIFYKALSNRDMVKYGGVTRDIAINFLKEEIEKYISRLSDEKSDIFNVD